MAWHKRAFAMMGAILFLVTSLSFTVLVIWSMSRESKQKGVDEGLQQALQQSKDNPTQKLAGTKLADFTPVPKVSELQKIDLQVGGGAEVKPNDTVTVHYTGALANEGTIFQSSLDIGQPVSFSLDQVIKGWTDGLPGMKVGGKRRLLIPAALAYGSAPPDGSGIPADTDLVFDIELVKIGQ